MSSPLVMSSSRRDSGASEYGATTAGPWEALGPVGTDHAIGHGKESVLWKRPRVPPPARKRNGRVPPSRWLASVSLVANVLLLLFKVLIVVRTRSLVVVASAVDSVLDLVAQLIILYALSAAGEIDIDAWPLGRSRLEPVGIIIVASLMGFASLQIVLESAATLWAGLQDPKKAKPPDVDIISVLSLLAVVATKLVLYVLCVGNESLSVQALAQDHINDVYSNSVVLLAAWSSNHFGGLWWLDPVGAIGISLFIVKRWADVGKEQAAMLVGRAAQPDFLEKIAELAAEHDVRMKVDWVRAFHFGKRFLVEVEAVMDKYTTLKVAHDVSLALQKKIELLRDVERAHVHVDYEFRDENEHKVHHTDDDDDDEAATGSGQAALRRV